MTDAQRTHRALLACSAGRVAEPADGTQIVAEGFLADLQFDDSLVDRGLRTRPSIGVRPWGRHLVVPQAPTM